MTLAMHLSFSLLPLFFVSSLSVLSSFVYARVVSVTPEASFGRQREEEKLGCVTLLRDYYSTLAEIRGKNVGNVNPNEPFSAGSPCQGFSFTRKQRKREKEKGGKRNETVGPSLFVQRVSQYPVIQLARLAIES